MNMIRSIVLALLASCLLGACYTNYNQYWMKNHQEHRGYVVRNVWTEGRADAPMVCRVGDEWYLRALRVDFRVRRRGNAHHWNSNWWAEHDCRALEETKTTAYHRITPELAQKLVGGEMVDDATLENELRRAGGDWLAALPQGGAVRLYNIKQKYSWSGVDTMNTHAPWYSYAAMGFTFVCVDVPCSTVLSLLELVYRPFDSLIMLYYRG